MIAIPIFIVLFCCILVAIKKMNLFEGNSQIILAVSVTALCLIALHQTFIEDDAVGAGRGTAAVGRDRPSSPPAATDRRPNRLIPVILLPYAALAVTLLLLPLLWLISAILRSNLWQRIRLFFGKITHQKSKNYRDDSSTNINRIPRGDR